MQYIVGWNICTIDCKNGDLIQGNFIKYYKIVIFKDIC